MADTSKPALTKTPETKPVPNAPGAPQTTSQKTVTSGTGMAKPAETSPKPAAPTTGSGPASPAPTPASPEGPAEGEEQPKRGPGRPKGSGSGAAAATAKPATPPSEMGMGQLLKAANSAAGKVKTKVADLVEAADALGELTDEMNKRLQ